MAQANNDSRSPAVKLIYLPLMKQLELLESVLNSTNFPFAHTYANAFMVLFVAIFKARPPMDALDDYWYVRGARTPEELRLALENMTSGPRDACALLEMVESCVSQTLLDLPRHGEVDCELSDAYTQTAECLKTEVALKYLGDLEFAVRVVGIEEMRVISHSLLSSLENIYSL